MARGRNTPATRHAANVSAARAVVAISAKLNREVDPRIRRIADMPEELSRVQPAPPAHRTRAAG